MYGISTLSFVGVCIFSFLHTAKGNSCDHLGTIIYEDLGCKPIMKNGKDCPIKYECNLEEKDSCVFRGREIPFNQQIPDDLINGNCYTGCNCKSFVSAEEMEQLIKDDVPFLPGGRFICAALDCAEYFGIQKVEASHRKYDLEKCCSTGILCDKPEAPVGKCQVSPDTMVLEGQRFYPPKTCMKCICPKNFNGTFEEPNCARVKCAAQIRYQDKIIRHCAPFYKANGKDPLCCPIEWICPTRNDKISTINPKADQTSDLRCKFGNTLLKLGEGFESKINVWNEYKKAKCECILPPFVTCTETKN